MPVGEAEELSVKEMTSGLRTVVRLVLCRVEYSVILFMLSFQLYQPLIDQYYYKTYGLQLIQQDNDLNSSANQAFCLTDELLTNYTGSNESYKQIQSQSNHLAAYGQLVQNIVGVLVTTFFIGPLTDRFGRKLGIAIPAVGSILQGIASICIISYNLNPYYFLITTFVAGLSGSFPSFLSSSFAYTTEDSSFKYRTFRIAAIEASIAFGGASGQLFGGFLLEIVHCNYIPPMILFLVSNVILLLYLLFILPEPSTKKNRMGEMTSKCQQIIAYLKGFRVYCGGLSIKGTWNIYVATVGANIAALTITGTVTVSVFFLKTPPFDLKPFSIGIYQAVRSFSQGLSNIILVGLFTMLFRYPDPFILLTGFLFSGFGNLFLGLSNQNWQIYICENQSNTSLGIRYFFMSFD